MNTNELRHYGILGMKWGVRKNRTRGVSKKRDMSSDAKDAANLKKKKVYQMSNAELKKLNERMQLERTYSDLKRKKASQIKKGADIVAGIVSSAAKETAKSYITKQMTKGLNKVVGP